ncbi:hypothetical protein FBULB1_933 [Fusarium bulbicola]|nr:hypothetical protein FBULB1_933 [Fusarium bulbicola]
MAAQPSPSNMELEQFQWDETSLVVGRSLLREGPPPDASCKKLPDRLFPADSTPCSPTELTAQHDVTLVGDVHLHGNASISELRVYRCRTSHPSEPRSRIDNGYAAPEGRHSYAPIARL